MLKINKILSKKIISPLSLRGAKRRSNLKGFSLIELMIAVTILALAIFGIFHAYSVGFLGMADARDRTVATNYAREAMEDVKNMDFELVTNENLGTAESVGEKFIRVISVNTENGNLKKITTLVYWNNRNGKTINIETSMYINRTLFNPGEAVKIVLYANPYYAVLPSAGVANIIAVIKDKNGNTKIDWTGGNIRFSITDGSEFGFLPDGAYTPGVEPINGQAVTIFTGSAEGDVVIEASVTLPDGSTVSDTITIAVTLDVVRIELLAVPDRIDADGTSTSTITAALKNSGDSTVITATNIITFNISGNKGTFVDSEGVDLPNSTTISPTKGIATIYVKSIIDTPGVATVTASSEGLLSDTVNIITIGDATSIYVSIVPNLIYIDDTEGARVTVEIQDVNGNPVEYSGKISLATSGGTGIFEQDAGCDPDSLCFNDVSSKYTTFSPTSVGTIIITASGGGLAAGNATINVRDPLIADTITLKAVPKNILAGGEVNSKITATIKQGSNVISTYNNEITFKIISDTSTYQDAKLSFNGFDYGLNVLLPVSGGDYGNDGVAVVYLKPASEVGICTIEVSTLVDPEFHPDDPPISETIEVGFYSGEDHIELEAVPPKMLVNGNICRVTARVVDEGGTQVITYSEDITFTILVGWPKIAKFTMTGTSSLTKTLSGGDTFVDLISQNIAGTVTLKASSFTGSKNITGYLNIPVVITLLELAPEPNITYDGNQVSFDIEVQGTEVDLVKMQVSWSPNDLETLNKIEIKSPSTAVDPIKIFDNIDEPASNGELINVNDITLLAGISNVKLYFDASMSGKTYNIIFYSSSGNYPVEFDVPSST